MATNLAVSIIQHAHKILNWTTWFKIEISLEVVGSCVLVIFKSLRLRRRDLKITLTQEPTPTRDISIS